MTRRLDLQGVEALLEGGSRVELSVDGGQADLQLGVLFEPLLPRRDSAFEVSHEHLGGAEVVLRGARRMGVAISS